MSNRLFQNVVTQMSEAIGKTVGVVDDTFTVCACNEPSLIGEPLGITTVDTANEDVFVRGDYTFKNFGVAGSAEYLVFVQGTDAMTASFVNLVAVSMANVKQYFDENFDRSNFIKNIILENIMPGDIYIKARELHFNAEVSHVVLLVRIMTKNDVSVFDIISNLFPDKKKDFIISISETEIAIVKETKKNIERSDLEKLARSIIDTLSGEFYTHCVIGIGTIVDGIKELASSFKEAKIALEVGKVFDTEKTIVSYENLGIARIIYQLPTTLCDTFLKEVFKSGSIESLDQETLFTIQKFFENNLNVSETSRKLFVHRNTLVYRLEKIKKLTGLDLREFEHAIVFKIALMVKKYLSSNPVMF
ncbi:MAG: helix-turn-helix domain-containing protein [Clostridia bacterium]|nr:helix-turn-helix domain-containing protein [Clostridia bacterium]